MNQHEIYKKIVWRGGDDLDDVNLEKLASLLAEMEKRIEGLEQRASWKDSPEGKKIVGDTLNNILHPQAECKHICDSEEYNPKCHKCGKLMRNDNPQEECKHKFPWGERCIKCDAPNPASGVTDYTTGKLPQAEKQGIDTELKKSEQLLAEERNLNQVSFYEGYIKGLKFCRQVEQEAYKRGRKDLLTECPDTQFLIGKTIQERDEQILKWAEDRKYTEDQGIDAEMESHNSVLRNLIHFIKGK